MIAVLDASMAVDIIRKKPAGLIASKALGEIDKVITPEFFKLEIASALGKYVKANILKDVDALELLNQCCLLVDEFIDIDALMSEVFLESIRLKHSVNDLPYLILARRFGAVLFTCDKRLYKLATKCGVWVYRDFCTYEC